MRPLHHLVIAGLAPVLVNCSTHPLVDDVTRTSTSDIVKHIRCEAKRAVIDDDLRSKSASSDTILAIAYEFTFTIFENNNAVGDIKWETLNLQLLANADSERQRSSNRTFRILDTFDELRRADCSRETLEKNLIYPIAGEIGIYEVVTTFAKLSRTASLKAQQPILPLPADQQPEPLNKVVFRFADTLTFITTFNGGVNPSLTLSPVTNSLRLTQVNAGSSLSPPLNPSGLTPSEFGLTPLGTTGLNAQRQDTHKVVIAMAGVPRTIDALRSRTAPRAPLSPNSITSTTEHQLEATAKERALFELDRQRMLALQQQSPNLLLGGP
jgi:hypothetical protein